jgi:AcrR family transcriptional regulator
MPPKKKFNKKEMLDAAFEIARNEGLLNLSARTIAESLGCSTSPIYSAFGSMEKVEEGVCKMSTELLLKYQTIPRTGFPFMDMGLGYIVFAKEEKRLFRDMFMNIDALKPFSQEMVKYASSELMDNVMRDDPALKCLDGEQKSELLQIMWTFSHGIATQMNINALGNRDEPWILSLLRRTIDPVIERMKDECPGREIPEKRK